MALLLALTTVVLRDAVTLFPDCGCGCGEGLGLRTARPLTRARSRARDCVLEAGAVVLPKRRPGVGPWPPVHRIVAIAAQRKLWTWRLLHMTDATATAIGSSNTVNHLAEATRHARRPTTTPQRPRISSSSPAVTVRRARRVQLRRFRTCRTPCPRPTGESGFDPGATSSGGRAARNVDCGLSA